LCSCELLAVHPVILSKNASSRSRL
jgi:hypothetical protein